MMNDTQSAREILGFLDSLKPWYPSGVSEVSAEAERRNSFLCWGQEGKLLFLTAVSEAALNQGTPFLGAEGSLIQAAILKGLKLNLDEVSLIGVSETDSRAELYTELENELKRFQPKLVLILGQRCFELCKLEGDLTSARGNVESVAGFSALVSHGLSDIVKSPERKREFWEDLKLAMKYL